MADDQRASLIADAVEKRNPLRAHVGKQQDDLLLFLPDLVQQKPVRSADAQKDQVEIPVQRFVENRVVRRVEYDPAEHAPVFPGRFPDRQQPFIGRTAVA